MRLLQRMFAVSFIVAGVMVMTGHYEPTINNVYIVACFILAWELARDT